MVSISSTQWWLILESTLWNVRKVMNSGMLIIHTNRYRCKQSTVATSALKQTEITNINQAPYYKECDPGPIRGQMILSLMNSSLFQLPVADGSYHNVVSLSNQPRKREEMIENSWRTPQETLADSEEEIAVELTPAMWSHNGSVWVQDGWQTKGIMGKEKV